MQNLKLMYWIFYHCSKLQQKSINFAGASVLGRPFCARCVHPSGCHANIVCNSVPAIRLADSVLGMWFIVVNFQLTVYTRSDGCHWIIVYITNYIFKHGVYTKCAITRCLRRTLTVFHISPPEAFRVFKCMYRDGGAIEQCTSITHNNSLGWCGACGWNCLHTWKAPVEICVIEVLSLHYCDYCRMCIHIWVGYNMARYLNTVKRAIYI